MADNVTVTAGVATYTAATDTIGGVAYQRVKLSLGADGTAADADVGAGTGGAATIRTIIDSSQLASLATTAQAMSSGYQPVGLVSDNPRLKIIGDGTEYETVAASQTAQALGATGATGDYIAGVLVIPATTSPGLVTLLDNAISIPVFVGGASSVSNLVPFFIPLGLISVSGAWKLTTGANVSCIGCGNFT